MFSSAENEAAAALRNAVKVERLADPITPVAEVLRRVPAKQLQALYKVPAFKDVDQFLQHIAAARGKLKKGGVADTTVSGGGGGGVSFHSLAGVKLACDLSSKSQPPIHSRIFSVVQSMCSVLSTRLVWSAPACNTGGCVSMAAFASPSSHVCLCWSHPTALCSLPLPHTSLAGSSTHRAAGLE